MSTQPQDKYLLRSLHEEIDLFDRKLAHLFKFGTYSTEAERDAAAAQLASKRALLANKAQKLVQAGVEFKTSELPRSLRARERDGEPNVVDMLPPAPEAVSVPVAASANDVNYPHAGTVMDVRRNLLEFSQRKKKEKS